jgi:replicative DNA helicase
MSRPKYSLETEQEVLETIMHFADHNNVRVQKAMLKLNTDCFYNADHKEIFRMIKDCFNKQEPFHFVDILVKIPHGALHHAELHATLSWLIDNYGKCHAGESNFEAYYNRLITLSKLRKQLDLAEAMVKQVRDCGSPEESEEILATAITEISGLSYRESKHGMSNIEIAEDYYDGKIVDEIKIPTASQHLNDLLQGGIMPKSLVIIAAGASVGKTGFSIFLLDLIARAQPGTESLFFSIEMEYKHIWMRHVGVCGGKPFDKLDKDERLAAVTKSMMVPIKIYDTTMCHAVADIDFILTTARLRAMERPISVIVVDYLSLVETKLHFERNDLKQSYITGKLAQLAIELNCTVIALSQINRGAANRGVEDRCPWPHDAADSSGGHRSASLWFGVDRPELYQDDPCYRNQFVVKCRKNRFGDTFETIFAFNGGSFAEVQAGWFRQPYAQPKSAEKTMFSGYSNDFYPNS